MGYKTLSIQGYTEKKPISTLIDYRPTHNFIDKKVARLTGCELQKINPQDVSVVDGRAIQSMHGCKNFKWLMQGATFRDDFMMLPIGDCDVVLGIQWLCKLGDIRVNFGKLMMELGYKGRTFKLQRTYLSFKIVEAKALEKVTTENA